jgi:hypothetical protein
MKKTASQMTRVEFWEKRGVDHYHADESPLFAANRNGVIHATIDCSMSRDTEDNLQEIGEAYLRGYQRESQKYQDRRV